MVIRVSDEFNPKSLLVKTERAEATSRDTIAAEDITLRIDINILPNLFNSDFFHYKIL